MDEMDYFRALGVEPDAPEEGEEEREPAEPAETTEDSVPQEEPAEDAGEPEPETAEEGEEAQEPAEPAAEDEGTPEPQTREERARQAAARRQRETEDAIREAVRKDREERDAELKELFGWAGFKNGTAPIESLDDLKKYKQQSDAAQLEKELKAGRLTPELLGEMVRNEIRNQTPQPPRADPAREAAFRQQVEAELQEIRKYDPSIQTVADFRGMENAEAFFREVSEHGHSFLEAYKIANADKIAAAEARKAAAAGAQRARNSARSKDHMRPQNAKGAGDVAVPPEVRAVYRDMMPEMTDEEIRRDYQKYRKGGN